MTIRDARGHTVPTGSDAARRQSILDLSMSIPSIRSVASESEASQYVAQLRAAGITPSDRDPAFVWRRDLGVLQVWNGTAWRTQAQVEAELSVLGDSPVSEGLAIGVRPAILKAGIYAAYSQDHQYGNGYMDYVTFQQPYPHKSASVVLTPIYSTGTSPNFNQGVMYYLDSVSRNGFRAMIPGESVPHAHAFSWLAMGY